MDYCFLGGSKNNGLPVQLLPAEGILTVLRIISVFHLISFSDFYAD